MELTIFVHGSADDVAAQAPDELLTWMGDKISKPAKRACEATASGGFVIGLDFHADRAPTLDVTGTPPAADLAAINAELANGPKTYFGTARFDLQCGLPPRPQLPPPGTVGTLGERVASLTTDARTFLVPLATRLATTACVTVECKGVRGTGDVLAALSTKGDYDAHALFREPAFWRSMLEAKVGFDSLPAFVDLAGGEVDRACMIARTLGPFQQPGPLGDHLRLLSTTCDGIAKEITARMAPGIALHDAGDFEGALKVYAQLLVEHPSSARILYERNLSRKSAGMEALFLAEQGQVVLHDPLFGQLVSIHGPDEVQRYLRRMKVMGGPTDTTSAGVANWLVSSADSLLENSEPGYAGVFYVAMMRTGLPTRSVEDLADDFLLAADRSGADLNYMFKDPEGMRKSAITREAARTH